MDHDYGKKRHLNNKNDKFTYVTISRAVSKNSVLLFIPVSMIKINIYTYDIYVCD